MHYMIDNIKSHFEELLRSGKTIPEIQDLLDDAIFEVQAELEAELKAKEAEEKKKIQKEKDADMLAAVIADFVHTYYPELDKRIGSLSADDVLKMFDELDRSLNLVFKFDWDGFADPIDKFLKKHNLS